MIYSTSRVSDEEPGILLFLLLTVSFILIVAAIAFVYMIDTLG